MKLSLPQSPNARSARHRVKDIHQTILTLYKALRSPLANGPWASMRRWGPPFSYVSLQRYRN
ncbi:hypothetical protein CBM2634_U100009 [Cupriavidus taiwanensis]|uniref:Uncharacterized protein n=1 Tax=Cupriavidus taiwanensis TaxID=164546 RepID=A0A375JFS7_9BURK|nr:hypothetical protein CBM2634_U100009 [Cupriavidus taiwanensis]